MTSWLWRHIVPGQDGLPKRRRFVASSSRSLVSSPCSSGFYGRGICGEKVWFPVILRVHIDPRCTIYCESGTPILYTMYKIQCDTSIAVTWDGYEAKMYVVDYTQMKSEMANNWLHRHAYIWANYNDLSRGHLKSWFSKGNLLFQGTLAWWNITIRADYIGIYIHDRWI